MIDAELGIVPINVRVRVEMFHHRLVAQLVNQIGIGIVLDRFPNALLFRNDKLFWHQILQDFSVGVHHRWQPMRPRQPYVGPTFGLPGNMFCLYSFSWMLPTYYLIDRHGDVMQLVAVVLRSCRTLKSGEKWK